MMMLRTVSAAMTIPHYISENKSVRGIKLGWYAMEADFARERTRHRHLDYFFNGHIDVQKGTSRSLTVSVAVRVVLPNPVLVLVNLMVAV